MSFELHHGDCLEIMPRLVERLDCIITDPPYGIKRDVGFADAAPFGDGQPIARRQYAGGWDNERPSAEVFKLMLSCNCLCLIFGGNFFADVLPQSSHWLVWDKNNTMPTFSDAELIYTNSPRTSVKIYKHTWNGVIGKEKKRYHPTQKPVSLIEKLIFDYTAPGDTICDPFMGSGTTGVAAIRTGRHFVGIEKEQEYFEIAQARMKSAQPALFVEDESLLTTACKGRATHGGKQANLFNFGDVQSE